MIIKGRLQVVYLRLRFLLLLRELGASGLIYSLLLAGSYCGYLYFFIKLLQIDESHTLLLSGFGIAPLLLIYSIRKDIQLLASVTPFFKTLLLIEYLTVCIPQIFTSLIFGRLITAIILILSAVMLARWPLKFKSHAGHGAKLDFIPAELFEFRSGVRQNLIPLIILIPAAFTASFFPYVSLVILWLLHLIILSFFQFNEPLSILLCRLISPASFLKRKLKLSLVAMNTLFTPVFALYTFFHPEHWIVSVFLLLFFSVSLCFSIHVKYAYYRPNESDGPFRLYQSLSGFSIFIPFLAPLPILLNFVYRKKAIDNLYNYVPRS